MADFTDLVDLASERVGGAAIFANDDFFAGKENLVKAKPAVFLEHEYTDRGKWMDGWESRRRRTPGHDHCLVRLGLPGVIRGVVVDTAFFRGNYPEHASIDATTARPDASPEELLGAGARWTEILPVSALRGDAKNLFAIESPHRWTHLRLNIFPDGGVARLRVHGEVEPDWRTLGRGGETVDVAAIENGGRVIACSDMFFGVRHNLVMPGRAANMGDGWETKRRRGLFPGSELGSDGFVVYPHHDWALVELCAEASVRRVEIDTNHFKGNYPESAMLEGARLAPGEDPAAPSVAWRPLLSRTRLQPHTRHFYDDALESTGPLTHVRLNVYPDGGVSRLRIFGVITRAGLAAKRLDRLDRLEFDDAVAELLSCCGSSAWASAMADARPFGSPEALFDTADAIWTRLDERDRREAFEAHPRIGERKAAPSQGATAAAWSRDEQSGVASAEAETTEALALCNREYEARFGHVFLICATGKSAGDMLAALRSRLANTASAELAIAAEEQRKITHLRLEKLLSS